MDKSKILTNWFIRPIANFGEHKYTKPNLIKELEKSDRIKKALAEHPPKKKVFGFNNNPIRRYLKEMVARPTGSYAYWVYIPLKFIWYRIFRGIEIKGLERVADETKGKTIIYMPCHRSHLDYGLVTYLLYTHNLTMPHILAGDNLNLPIIGRLLARCGAVFIRRVFRGKPLYTATFLSYFYKLLDTNCSIEYFIEGGRSRTGKNLPPKTGILAMLAQYLLERKDKDLIIVPVSVTYEKLMEENEYVKELGGIPKRKESLGDLIKVYRLLNVNYGRVYVSFAPPISMRSVMDNYVKQNALAKLELESAHFEKMVDEFAGEIMDDINTYCTSSTLPILANALLSERRQGFRKQELIDKSNFLLSVYRQVHPRGYDTIIGDEKDIEHVIEFLFKSGSVRLMPDSEGDIYFFRFQNKIRLNIYKNIVLHHFVIPSLIALELEHNQHTEQSLVDHVLKFDHLFRYEFLFPKSYDLKQNVYDMVNFAISLGVITKEGENIKVNHDYDSELKMLAHILFPYWEAFHVALYTLEKRDVIYPVSSKELVKKMQSNFVNLHLLGQIVCPEVNITVTYKNIIKFLLEENYLKVTSRKGKNTYVEPSTNFPHIKELDGYLTFTQKH